MAETTNQVTTAKQLAALPEDGNRYELVEGVLHVMSPTGGRHGQVAATLLFQLTGHVRRRNLGVTFAAETGFLIYKNPDTVRAPDAAFVSYKRLGQFADHPGFLPFAPDLVAEVVSPHDSPREVETKTQAWLEAGVRVVLVVDPQALTVRACRPGRSFQVPSPGLVDLDDVLPGFELDVVELFA